MKSTSKPSEVTSPSATIDELIPADLQKVAAAVTDLPDEYRRQLAPLMDAVIESTKRRRRILTLVQDALGQLRLDMKYLMFDLEATRREREQYRLKLEELDS